MLIIPDKIQIDFRDKNDNPLTQDKILIGIKTFATYKNDINVSPFTSDKNGIIIISKKDIERLSDEYILDGLMDYSSIETAKPDIEIYFIGVTGLNKRIELLRKMANNRNYLKQQRTLGTLDKKLALIEKNNSERLEQYLNCFNLNTKVNSDKTLTADTWDRPATEKCYVCRLDFV